MFAYASSTTGSTTGGLGGSWMSWVIIIVMFAAIYFLTIRPQNKRDKEARQMRDSLKPGDEIVTIGGIYGKVVRVTEDRVIIIVGSEKTKLEMAKSAISQVVSGTQTAQSSKTKAAEEPAKESAKTSPKIIKKLGAAKEAAEETADKAEAAAEAVSDAAETVAAEAAESTEA